MNNILETMERLQRDALSDDKLRKELLETEKEESPFSAFCKKAREKGYPIYDMELIVAGEEFYASIKRSTNGGGENSPKLSGQDDLYEMFMAAIRYADKV